MDFAGPARAVVFDFDGTIMDTETPIFEGWRVAYERAGAAPLDRDAWIGNIGLASGEGIDFAAALCVELGVGEIPAPIEELRRQTTRELMHALPLRDGVLAWIEASESRGVPLAIASSSGTRWVESNLCRLGLRDRFEFLSCADPGVPGKPDPAVYTAACRGLGVAPAKAVAIEDSPRGATSAITAGLRCIAAPGPMTASLDCSHATVQVASLGELDPDEWLGEHP